MRCKKHPIDLSSAAGVCATCLRERLLKLIDEQARADEALGLAKQLAHSQSRFSDDRRRPELQPSQPAFPRSVSPYVTRRKSDNCHRRFYSTPQVGPTFSSASSFPLSKKKQSKFSRFVNLFRSRSDKIDSDPSVCSNSDPRISPPRDSCQAPSSSSHSSSWLSFLPHRRRQKQQATGDTASAHAGRRPCRISNRGMSPESGVEEDDHFESGYSSESSQQGWRRTPVIAVTPASVQRKRAGHAKTASGMAFCLSPLVRASPSRQWNQKGGLQPDIGVSGEIRAPGKPYLSTAASFSGNRSRKLADFGRAGYNR